MGKRILKTIVTALIVIMIICIPANAATSTVIIAKGGTKQLKIKPSIKKAVSNKKSVASVTNKGLIKAKKKGTATITITDIKNKTHKFKVIVESPTLNKKALSIEQGKKYTLKLKNNTQKVKWSSNKKKIAIVSSKGQITAKSPGKAIITAKIPNGPTYKCKVTVKKVKPTLTSLSSNERNFLVNSSTKVTFTVVASASVKDTIKLYDAKGNAVATMRDNGRNGDKKKGDGVYTCVIKVKRSSAGSEKYYAKAGTLKTSKISLYFFEGAKQNDREKVNQVAQKFDQISSKYEDAQGNVLAMQQKP